MLKREYGMVGNDGRWVRFEQVRIELHDAKDVAEVERLVDEDWRIVRSTLLSVELERKQS